MTKKIDRTWLRTMDAARYYYKITGDRLPTDQTIRNWMSRGKRGYDGTLIKLKYVSRGNIRVTCTEWIEMFAEEVSNGRAERTIRGKAKPSVKRRKVPPPPPPV